MWKSRTIESELERLRAWSITPTSEVLQTLSDMSESPIYSAVSLADLLKRPSLSYQDMARFGFDVKDLPPDVISEIEVQLKYDAYLRKQERDRTVCTYGVESYSTRSGLL